MYEEIFEKYANDYGRPVFLPPPDPNDPDADVLQLPFFELNQAIGLFADKVSPSGLKFRGYVGILQDGVTNARSEYFDDLHIAVFGMRFCVELYMHFQCLLSHPGVFSGVGESEKEEVRIGWNNTAVGSALLHFGPLRPGEMFGPLAKDPQRRAVATRLYLWAMRFIGFHEIGHLTIGHVHLLREMEGRSKIEDSVQAYGDPSYNRLRRALELQADLHALQRIAVHTLLLGKAPVGNPDLFSLTVFEMFTAITAVLRIWTRGLDSPIRGVVDSYPHPTVRFVSMVEAIRTRFESLHVGADDQQAWAQGVGISITETAMQDIALGCEQPYLDWIGDWDTVKLAYKSLLSDFRDANLMQRLAQYCVDPYFNSFDLLN